MRLNPFALKDEACEEAYEYFNKNIRKLPKNSDGSFNEGSNEFVDSDVDAFRHAYVSGVFTQEYGEKAAHLLGELQEMISFFRTTGGGEESTNMDRWNNAIGRKYGKKTRKRETLAEALLRALKNGEMITSLDDARKYLSLDDPNLSLGGTVVVLKQNWEKSSFF